MNEVIKNVDCDELPDIAHQKESFKADIVDEIVLRCLINKNIDPVLTELLSEARG